jgi:hypothetical protein
MENNNLFDKISQALNKDVNHQLKEKKIMKTLLLTSTKSYISKTYSMELLNLFTSFFCSIYFIIRTYVFAENSILLWTGLIASALWIFQLIYSYVGYKKMTIIKTGDDSIVVSIKKITEMITHYDKQLKIYIWGAPITIAVCIPIPLFEVYKIDLALAKPGALWYVVGMIVVATVVTIFLSIKYWEIGFKEPLENAKQNLQEILE